MYIVVFSPGSSLKCYDGMVTNETVALDMFHGDTACQESETWCFSLHSSQDKKPLEWKRCWDPSWEHGQVTLSSHWSREIIHCILIGQYDEDGCIVGQHCIMGTCYENATVCLCQGDNCNSWLPGPNNTVSTPIPYPPTTPADKHTCYYGIRENNTLSLDNTQVDRETFRLWTLEQLS